MPFTYDPRNADFIEAIILGLVERDLSDARTIYLNNLHEVEESYFEDAESALSRIERGQIRQVMRELRDAQPPGVHRDAFDQRLRSEELEAAADEFAAVFRKILEERDAEIYMSIPTDLLVAIDLLFQATLLRFRMWNDATETLRSVTDVDVAIKVTDDLTWSRENPPVDAAIVKSFATLIDYASEILDDVQEQSNETLSTDRLGAPSDELATKALQLGQEFLLAWRAYLA